MPAAAADAARQTSTSKTKKCRSRQIGLGYFPLNQKLPVFIVVVSVAVGIAGVSVRVAAVVVVVGWQLVWLRALLRARLKGV